ncbi:MAG: glucose-6-phosphate isomerase, partial [Eubacteriales bacterium]|nr:glucose-6-phosphate isomerase [Eubacteriales bacterium]
MKININTDNTGIPQKEIEELRGEAGKVLDRLWSGGEPMTGWVQAPSRNRGELLEKILAMADVIRNEAELLLVIGVGGSYLGAKAAIEALPKYERGIPVKFLGNNLCSEYYLEIIEEVKKKKTVVCVVSKSGNTIEVRTAFEVIKPVMTEKYGSEEEAARRIMAITDGEKGSLRAEATEKGYVTLEIPQDIGGRYSVFTPEVLLPMAVSGIDIRAMLDGAADCAESPEWDLAAPDYAIVRYLLQQKGKQVEFLEMCHSRLGHFGEWLKQLFGESEGKNGGGLLPTVLTFSTDLHSMGQYL